jgi:hypothetical protein
VERLTVSKVLNIAWSLRSTIDLSSKLFCRDVVTKADNINLSRDHDVRVHADPRVYVAHDCPNQTAAKPLHEPFPVGPHWTKLANGWNNMKESVDHTEAKTQSRRVVTVI